MDKKDKVFGGTVEEVLLQHIAALEQEILELREQLGGPPKGIILTEEGKV